MSEHIDAAVIAGFAYKISGESPINQFEDFEHGLWYVQNGKVQWGNGEPITEQDKQNLYAGDAFLHLGQIVTRSVFKLKVKSTQQDNPFREIIADAAGELVPFSENTEIIAPKRVWREAEVADSIWDSEDGFNETIIKRILSPVLKNLTLEQEDELNTKWKRALEIESNRGNPSIMTYDVGKLFEGLEKLDFDSIAPDTVEFNDEGKVVTQSHNLGGIIERTGIKAEPTDVPYYSTFAKDNANEMLNSALQDLTEVHRVVQTA